jgi:hypothetical protein
MIGQIEKISGARDRQIDGLTYRLEQLDREYGQIYIWIAKGFTDR